jgi:hypothetical protein
MAEIERCEEWIATALTCLAMTSFILMLWTGEVLVNRPRHCEQGAARRGNL